MNVKLLERVKAHILEEPKRLDMDIWLDRNAANKYDAPKCGTVGCIAGWACQLSGVPRDIKITVSQQAIGLLQLEEFYGLFYVEEWPESFRAAYELADRNDDHKEKARITAERIDAYIRAEGKE